MNVRINTKDLSEKDYADRLNTDALALLTEAQKVLGAITTEVHNRIV
jgi:formiminotetrahydrofolate cyclodeaminase